MEPAQVKKCNKCKLKKEISQFSKNKSKSDGLSGECKECAKSIMDKWRKEHLEKTRGYSANYYKDYPEEHRASCAKWRRGQKENPEFVKTPQMWYFRQLERNAKKRSINFNLTYQELLDSNHSQNCCFCGIEIKFTRKMEQSSGNQNASLDRINSGKGYELGNIQWCCWECNQLKRDYKEETFIQLCNNIAHTNPRPYLT